MPRKITGTGAKPRPGETPVCLLQRGMQRAIDKLIKLPSKLLLEMYKSPGVRSGAWLTEKETYRPFKGFGNYGLMPVGYKNADKDWERARKELVRDFQGIRRSAGTASRKAIKAIENAYDCIGIWGLSSLGMGGTLWYVCHEHPGDQYEWLKKPLVASLLGSLTKAGIHLEKKFREYRELRQERENERQRNEIRRDYFQFRKEMKEALRDRGGLDEEMNAKYVIGVQDFTKLLGGKGGPEELRNGLKGLRTRFKNYMEMEKQRKINYENGQIFGDTLQEDGLRMVA